MPLNAQGEFRYRPDLAYQPGKEAPLKSVRGKRHPVRKSEVTPIELESDHLQASD